VTIWQPCHHGHQRHIGSTGAANSTSQSLHMTPCQLAQTTAASTCIKSRTPSVLLRPLIFLLGRVQAACTRLVFLLYHPSPLTTAMRTSLRRSRHGAVHELRLFSMTTNPHTGRQLPCLPHHRSVPKPRAMTTTATSTRLMQVNQASKPFMYLPIGHEMCKVQCLFDQRLLHRHYRASRLGSLPVLAPIWLTHKLTTCARPFVCRRT
jgi:hypothetical protein